MKDKPAKPAAPPPATDRPGRLETDDRGNMTWQWADDADLQADDEFGTAERLRVLLDPKLGAGDEFHSLSAVQDENKQLKNGYNPYNSGLLGKQSWKKKRDLRQLSEWIELKKKLDGDPKGPKR